MGSLTPASSSRLKAQILLSEMAISREMGTTEYLNI
jgi:hypothetical protein